MTRIIITDPSLSEARIEGLKDFFDKFFYTDFQVTLSENIVFEDN